MKERLFALFFFVSFIISSSIGQTQEKEQQDAQKEKEWSGLQMPSWVFSSIGVFIQ